MSKSAFEFLFMEPSVKGAGREFKIHLQNINIEIIHFIPFKVGYWSMYTFVSEKQRKKNLTFKNFDGKLITRLKCVFNIYDIAIYQPLIMLIWLMNSRALSHLARSHFARPKKETKFRQKQEWTKKFGLKSPSSQVLHTLSVAKFGVIRSVCLLLLLCHFLLHSYRHRKRWTFQKIWPVYNVCYFYNIWLRPDTMLRERFTIMFMWPSKCSKLSSNYA